MTQYTSIHSGVDIDRAVSYYKSIDAYGRTILSVKVTEDNWMDVPSDKSSGGDSLIVGENSSNNYIKISLSGTYKLGGAPLVYFVDDNGQQWYIDHIFTPLSTDGNFDPTNIQNIYCLSNIKIAGAIVITCNLTDINFAIENEQGEFINQSPISAKISDI